METHYDSLGVDTSAISLKLSTESQGTRKASHRVIKRKKIIKFVEKGILLQATR